MRLVFREAYGIEGKNLGPEWNVFVKQAKGEPARNKDSQVALYKKIFMSRPLDDKKIIEACEALLWLFSHGHVNRNTFCNAIRELE
jgi:hypothetical protein